MTQFIQLDYKTIKVKSKNKLIGNLYNYLHKMIKIIDLKKVYQILMKRRMKKIRKMNQIKLHLKILKISIWQIYL